MKLIVRIFVAGLLTSQLFAQDALTQFDFSQPLSLEICGDAVKAVWDQLKTYAQEYSDVQLSKGEFESSSAFQERLQRTHNQIIWKVNKFAADSKLDSRTISVYLKAQFDHYDADQERYNIRTTEKISVPPSKDFIHTQCKQNNYVDIVELNEKGYRRANFSVKTKPEFVWYVNNQTARAAKEKENNIYFELWFKLAVDTSDPNNITLQLVPTKISLLDKNDNFTYWSTEIH